LLERACWYVLLIGLLVSVDVVAQQNTESRYLVEIELHTEAELLDALERSEQLFAEGVLTQGATYPVRFVLHGPEVQVLLRENYREHKGTVDLAARLSALGIVDMKVCETWMGHNRVLPGQLPPFIGTVPYAPREARRLMREDGYDYF
jgi:hypothetical protein